jgi:hypothetical protein
MSLVKTDGASTIVEWPYSRSKLRLDAYPSTIPQSPTNAQLAEFNVFPVTLLPQPAYDPATQRIQKQAQPVLNVSTWELDWDVIALSQADQDELARVASDNTYYSTVTSNRLTIRGMENDELRDVIGIIYSEAKGYEANNAVATPAIQACATEWGVTRGQAVTRIINKYGSYIGDVATAFAVREDELDALP